jgi:2-(1,2-epoxy-1,2-dihydrophenyl)acetyl-CoA isomerase
MILYFGQNNKLFCRINLLTLGKEENMEEMIILAKDNRVAKIILNKPKSYHAFDLEMISHFGDIMISLATDRLVDAIIITGTGKAFCAGGDLNWTLHFKEGLPAAFHELSSRFHQAILEIRRMSKPVIAAINGIAAGGGFSLALACDFRIMAKSAALRQGFTSNGLSMDGGATFALPRIVGLARALEIAAFDKPITAEQALSWGLITHIADDGNVVAEAESLARKILQGSIFSFGRSKQLLTDSFDSSFETQIQKERQALFSCAAHGDGREGLKAFLEKRKPEFNKDRQARKA